MRKKYKKFGLKSTRTYPTRVEPKSRKKSRTKLLLHFDGKIDEEKLNVE